MQKVVDWSVIKTQYITSAISYKKLAEEWGVSTRTLADRACREQWPRLRAEYRNKIVFSSVKKVEKKESARAAEQLLKMRKSADRMSDVILRIFNDAEQFHRYIIQKGKGGETDSEERLFAKIDTKAIKDLTGAMRDLVMVIRDVNDLPTVQQLQAYQLAVDKFNFEKEKDEKARRIDSELEVIFKPMEEASAEIGAENAVSTKEWSD